MTFAFATDHRARLVVAFAVAALAMLPACYRTHRLGDGGGIGGPDGGTPEGELPGQDAGPRPPPESPDDVRATCEDGPVSRRTFTVSFDEQMFSCPWNNPPNSSPTEGRATARQIQTQRLELPAGAVLCDLSLDFLGDDDDPDPVLRYDDNFALLFGDVVLAASDRSMVERLDRRGALVLWDWRRIVDQRMATRGGIPWCLGEDDGLSSCQIPPTEIPGPIRLRFDEALIDELSFRAFDRDDFRFRFVTIGDNDPVIDCGHEAFSFEAETTFVPR